MWLATEGGEPAVLASGVQLNAYIAIELTAGTNYDFYLQSRNSYSYSALSEKITLLCAFKPEPPLVITTSNVNELVLIEWDQPVTNGSPILSYRIFIQETNQGDFFEVQQTCDGSSTEVISSRSCTVTLEELKGIVFNLVQGESVWVKVITANVYGESVISEAGNNAVIQLVPDAPLNL